MREISKKCSSVPCGDGLHILSAVYGIPEPGTGQVSSAKFLALRVEFRLQWLLLVNSNPLGMLIPAWAEDWGSPQYLPSALLCNPFTTLLLGGVSTRILHTPKGSMDRIQLVTSLGKKLQLYFHSSLIESTSFNKDKQQTTVILTFPVIFVTNRNNR